MLKIDIKQAKILASYLSSSTLEEIITFARHNKTIKEFVIFEREDLSYL